MSAKDNKDRLPPSRYTKKNCKLNLKMWTTANLCNGGILKEHLCKDSWLG